MSFSVRLNSTPEGLAGVAEEVVEDVGLQLARVVVVLADAEVEDGQFLEVWMLDGRAELGRVGEVGVREVVAAQPQLRQVRAVLRNHLEMKRSTYQK